MNDGLLCVIRKEEVHFDLARAARAGQMGSWHGLLREETEETHGGDDTAQRKEEKRREARQVTVHKADFFLFLIHLYRNMKISFDQSCLV